MEETRYYQSIATMNKEAVRSHLSEEGYRIRSIQLRDIASELVYEVDVISAVERAKLYVDPLNGSVLKKEVLK